MTPVVVNWRQLAEKFKAARSAPRIKRLAGEWRVPTETLDKLGIGWSAKHCAFTFPELNARQEIIGIMRRDARTGEKRMIPGSQRGLYIARGWSDPAGPVLIPEGVSDTVVLLALGLAAVGRPSCTGGVDLLADLLADVDRQVIVVGENDVKPDGRWPGRDGAKAVAEQLARRLDRDVHWSLPPCGFKDVRDCRTRGDHHGK